MQLLGIDFSCAPSRRKPVVVARGRRRDSVVTLHAVQPIPTLAGFETLLAEPGPWLGGFDFPFGLPRAFVQACSLGDDAATVIAALHRRCGSRMALRALIDDFGRDRPPGQRLVHRATDSATPGVSSTSPLQTRYVPVAFMYYEGFARLVAAGVDIPALVRGDPERTALEAWPGLLARELVGRRSYKNSDAADRRAARAEMVASLVAGRLRSGLRLAADAQLAASLVADAGGDRLDAVLCMMQAAYAARRPDCGLAPQVDPVEGWIIGAGVQA